MNNTIYLDKDEKTQFQNTKSDFMKFLETD